MTGEISGSRVHPTAAEGVGGIQHGPNLETPGHTGPSDILVEKEPIKQGNFKYGLSWQPKGNGVLNCVRGFLQPRKGSKTVESKEADTSTKAPSLKKNPDLSALEEKKNSLDLLSKAIKENTSSLETLTKKGRPANDILGVDYDRQIAKLTGEKSTLTRAVAVLDKDIADLTEQIGSKATALIAGASLANSILEGYIPKQSQKTA